MKMLDNVTYDKIKLLHQLSSINWFIEKHAKNDAHTAGNQEFLSLLNNMQEDLKQYIEQLQQNMCIVTQ